jgi:O-acetylhomoserine/O-acetylserine sulfhydrylase-like pyridoxal-dependent enzyme
VNGGVNPSISDSTYTLSAENDVRYFEGNMEGCYSRHSSPSNLYLDKALAAMEGTETANVLLLEWDNYAYTIAIMQLKRSHCF